MNRVEEKNGEDDTLLLAHNDTSECRENTWYLNTSASNHKKQKHVHGTNESVNGDVAFENDLKVLVKGKYNILFRENVT